MKKKIYRAVAGVGRKALAAMFPEFLGTDATKPADRFLEYNFITTYLPRPPKDILDIGCVGSLFPLVLSGFGYNVWCNDIREYEILRHIKFPRLNFIRGNIREINIDRKFDVIMLISTVEHIGIGGNYGQKDEVAGDLRTMEKVRDMLKPGGLVFLTLTIASKHKIVKPLHRIYDLHRLDMLIKDFIILESRMYIEKEDWHEAEVLADGEEGVFCMVLKNRKEI